MVYSILIFCFVYFQLAYSNDVPYKLVPIQVYWEENKTLDNLSDLKGKHIEEKLDKVLFLNGDIQRIAVHLPNITHVST